MLCVLVAVAQLEAAFVVPLGEGSVADSERGPSRREAVALASGFALIVVAAPEANAEAPPKVLDPNTPEGMKILAQREREAALLSQEDLDGYGMYIDGIKVEGQEEAFKEQQRKLDEFEKKMGNMTESEKRKIQRLRRNAEMINAVPSEDGWKMKLEVGPQMRAPSRKAKRKQKDEEEAAPAPAP